MKKFRLLAPAVCVALFGSAAALGANLDNLNSASVGQNGRVASAAPYSTNATYAPYNTYDNSAPYAPYADDASQAYAPYGYDASYYGGATIEDEKWLSGSVVGSWLDGYLRQGHAAHGDQVWLTAQKTAHGAPGAFDLGYRVDALFGTTNTQSFGDGGFDARWGVSKDGYGASIYQAYSQVALGSLSGKFGKFGTILGYESVNNAECALNTHTYMFAHEATTHTGGLFTFAPTDQFSIDVGLVSGADCSFENRRGDTGFLFGASLQLAENLKVSYASALNQIHSELGENRAALSSGYYELGGAPIGDQDEYLQSFTVSADLTDRLGYAFTSNYGIMQDRANHLDRYSQLGFANYLTYKLTCQLMAVARYEYYTHKLEDADVKGKIHDVTLGLLYKPTENIFIRPDARYDWVDQNGKSNGFTGAVGCGFVF